MERRGASARYRYRRERASIGCRMSGEDSGERYGKYHRQNNKKEKEKKKKESQ